MGSPVKDAFRKSLSRLVQASWHGFLNPCYANLSLNHPRSAISSRRRFSTTTTANIRLINAHTLELAEFVGSRVPPYAILSHTWGDQEISLHEMRDNRALVASRTGFTKIKRTCAKALANGHDFVWVDSCCIDKQSSAELSEAINSMHKWYRSAAVCYAYLSDVSGSASSLSSKQFSASRWFTRGWTLQELIAPRRVDFFAQDWSPLGTRQTLLRDLEAITGISWEVLSDDREVSAAAMARACTAQRMLWASRRQTTREEDMAYCLMGMFGVHMPIIYGEGLASAFKRLQLEIVKSSPDQSIFAWAAKRQSSGLLAEDPAAFAGAEEVIRGTEGPHWWATMTPFSMTNFGVAINLPMYIPADVKEKRLVLARIGARRVEGNPLAMHPIMIYLKAAVKVIHGTETKSFYRRVRCDEFVVGPMERSMTMYGAKHAHTREDIYVPEDDLYHAFMESSLKWAGSYYEAFVG